MRGNRIPLRALMLTGFFAVGLAIVGYIYVNVGGYVPFFTENSYTASARFTDVDNVVTAGHVSSAGVQIGSVRSTERTDGGITVEFTVDRRYAPLHAGAHIRLGERSLVGESYLDLTDGTGAPLPEGTEIPSSAVQQGVQLHDVLASMDAGTRQDLGELLRSTGAATDGTARAVDGLFAGLGGVGRGGATMLDSLAAQSVPLRRVGDQTTRLLRALDTGEGQLVTLVDAGQRLTRATAAEQGAIAGTVRELPPTLDSARAAAAGIRELSSALTPVAARLKQASGPLADALSDLPRVSTNLRGVVKPLRDTIDLAPNTFSRTDQLADDVRGIAPPARELLRDADPMLTYLRPYAPDLAAFLANFNAVFGNTDEQGTNYLRLLPEADARSVQTPAGVTAVTPYLNPLPKPGSLPNPGPFSGRYPRVERLPN